MLWIIHILWRQQQQQKKNNLAHNIKKKTKPTLFKILRVVAHDAQFSKKKTPSTNVWLCGEKYYK
jgi:hypothetical protein